jgi:phage baseplate assembly protein gpV
MSVKANRIELDKTDGLTILLCHGQNTQKIFLDGDKLTITVAGPGGTSTIEQTPTRVTVTADEFIVKASTITQTGNQVATMQSNASKLELKRASAEVRSTTLSLTADELHAKAETLTLTGEATTVGSSEGKVELKGSTIDVGDAHTTITGTVHYEPGGGLDGL